MNIELASHLHLKFLAKRFPGKHLNTPDVLVLAGDISTGTKAIDYFGEWPVPVVYVRGNHESYSSDIDRVEERLRVRSAGSAVHFLERDRVDLAGIRFLGCTLWTDYELPTAPNVTRPLAMTRPRVISTTARRSSAEGDASGRYKPWTSTSSRALGSPSSSTFRGPGRPSS